MRIGVNLTLETVCFFIIKYLIQNLRAWDVLPKTLTFFFVSAAYHFVSGKSTSFL